MNLSLRRGEQVLQTLLYRIGHGSSCSEACTIRDICRVAEQEGNILRDYSGTSLPERPVWSTNVLIVRQPSDLRCLAKSLI